MELGQKIRAARLEAGLSQRQLCGQRLTRNMLSQIENGSARPSMATLGYLAQALGKSVSYFLDEQSVASPNRDCVAAARQALAAEDTDALAAALEAFREPDPEFGEEATLLRMLCLLRQARQALDRGQLPYARSLLERAGSLTGLYITPLLQRQRLELLALAGVPQSRLEADSTLLALALSAGSPQRQLTLLEAAADHDAPRWLRARGDALFALARYAEAAACYTRLAPTGEVLERLELCCREQGDYKGAYGYACRRRDLAP